MRTHNPQHGSIRSRIILALLILITYIPSVTYAREANAEDGQSTKEQELKQAQIDYYKAQTEKLRNKSLYENVIENPASIMTVIGAFIAAFIALISLIVNYRMTVRTQRDTQFYEALKRFGDKDSATVRASAAGLLAQISNRRTLILGRRPYVKTAVDQLVTGLLLERDPVALLSISDALRQLFSSDVLLIERLHAANQKLYRDLWEKIIEWAVNNHITRLEDIAEDHLAELEALTENGLVIAQQLLFHLNDQTSEDTDRVSKQFSTECKTFQGTYGTTGGNKIIKARRELIDISDRLAVVNDLYVESIKLHSLTRSRRMFKLITRQWSLDSLIKRTPDLVGAFLPKAEFFEGYLEGLDMWGAWLQNAEFYNGHLRELTLSHARMQKCQLFQSELDNVDLTSAYLKDAQLSFATLSDVDMREADLRGANLAYTKFKGVRLSQALIDDETDLNGAEWWKADFTLAIGRKSTIVVTDEVDVELIRYLRGRYNKELLQHSTEWHSTVRAFIDKEDSKTNSL